MGTFVISSGLWKRNAFHGGVRQRLGLGRSLGVVGVHPRVVLADVDHLEIERVQPSGGHGVAEGVLVQLRRAGRNNDAVKPVLADVLPDQFLAGIGAHVFVIAREDDPGKFADIFRDRRTVHDATDVVAAVADVKADANIAVGMVHFHGSFISGGH